MIIMIIIIHERVPIAADDGHVGAPTPCGRWHRSSMTDWHKSASARERVCFLAH